MVFRIAAKAVAGSFWCSDEFVNSLADKSVCKFTFKGRHLFKNVIEEKKVLELSIEKARINYTDPVCRMLILKLENAIQHPGESERYF